MRNIILNTDSYKASHYLQYPKALEYLSAYIESRRSPYPYNVFFGLQGWLKNLHPITQEDIDEAEYVLSQHIPGLEFNRKDWQYILRQHDGVLPIRIDAVKEGTKVPASNVLLQITNTDPRLPWLPQYLETSLLRSIWYATTVCSRSKFIKEAFIRPALIKTSDNVESELPFKLHDFGFRGVSSFESAEIGGAAHLVNFMGTDTMAALGYLRRNYSATSMPAFSIPAAEHSTVMAWEQDGEMNSYLNMVSQFGGKGRLFAVVSDTYDIYKAVKDIWCGTLKDQVLNNGGTLVVRPDSGKPHVPSTVLDLLGDGFGWTVNSKGYRVLPPQVRVIHGDSVSETTIPQVYSIMQDSAHMWAADNLAFGMGGELLQKVDRDTLGFAQKASAVKFGGNIWRPISKSPIDDPGKKSKAGRLALVESNGKYQTIQEHSLSPTETNLLERVWEDGKLIREQTLEEIRNLSNK